MKHLLPLEFESTSDFLCYKKGLNLTQSFAEDVSQGNGESAYQEQQSLNTTVFLEIVVSYMDQRTTSKIKNVMWRFVYIYQWQVYGSHACLKKEGSSNNKKLYKSSGEHCNPILHSWCMPLGHVPWRAYYGHWIVDSSYLHTRCVNQGVLQRFHTELRQHFVTSISLETCSACNLSCIKQPWPKGSVLVAGLQREVLCQRRVLNRNSVFRCKVSPRLLVGGSLR